MADTGKARRINLFCPSLSKLASIVAWDDQRLDLGTIARTFGIDPASLRLNGHFISRGVDLIASSVTWRSLLSFFSARGLSTGTAGSPALIVDGKLYKSGAKRAHDPAEAERAECADRSLLEAVRVSLTPKKMKLKGDSSGSHDPAEDEKAECADRSLFETARVSLSPKKMKSKGGGSECENLAGSKRRIWQDANNPMKRSKTDGTYLGAFSKCIEGSWKAMRGSGKLTCGYQSGTTKRAREEEETALMADARKKSR